MFETFDLKFKHNVFPTLESSCEFEDVTTDRKGTNIIDCKDDLIPIVRTTSVYTKPVQKFSNIHHEIIDKIRSISYKNLRFNNALVEIYDSKYRIMGYHSDQALDLEENSYICIFSCYQDPAASPRKLKIKNKTSLECSELSLDHNSIVLFSTTTNRNHLHKIVLEAEVSSRWLGITFRLSKTYIQFMNEIPYFHGTDKILTIANEEEKKEFFKCRGKENSSVMYYYLDIYYTISVSDTLRPITNG